jgi:hypothetical protein
MPFRGEDRQHPLFLIIAGPISQFANQINRLRAGQFARSRREFKAMAAKAFRQPFGFESSPIRMPNMIWLYRRPILAYWSRHQDTLESDHRPRAGARDRASLWLVGRGHARDRGKG